MAKARLRRSILGGVLLGLFLYSFYQMKQPPPLVRIGSITSRMNFSTVSVQGVLKSNGRQFFDHTVLYFLVDETGTLPIFLDTDSEEILLKEGCRLTATGFLYVGAKNQVRMKVQSMEQLVVEPWVPLLHPVGSVGVAGFLVAKDGAWLTLSGQVSRIWTSPPSSSIPSRIILSDPAGSVDVVYWFERRNSIALGDLLAIRGQVDSYNGSRQLKIRSAYNIKFFNPEKRR